MKIVFERVFTCGILERVCFPNSEFETRCRMPNYHQICIPHLNQAPVCEIVNCTEISKQVIKMEVLNMPQYLIENEKI